MKQFNNKAIKQYYTLTLGCQMNKLDAEKIDALLQKMNFKLTSNEREADLIIVLACSVRQSAIDRIHGRIKRWKQLKKEKPLITLLTGCVLPADRKGLGKQFDILLDMQELRTLPEKLRQKMKDIEDIFLESDYFKLPTKHESAFQAFVPISNGCNKFCTYCAVPYTRGREISRPASQIIQEVEELIKNGYKEITLLGQTVNSYKNPEKEGVKNFADLLKRLAEIKGDFWLRFLSSHPLDFSDKLIAVIAQEKKICPHLHLPVQSGSNAVLKRMLRKYTREEYLKLIKKIKQRIPGVAITTDIIVGFCGETEADFGKTLDLYRQAEFDLAYLAQYSVRAGTQAAKRFKDDLPKAEKRRREKILNDLVAKIALKKNEALVGKKVSVLIEANKKSFLLGKTDSSKAIRLNGGSKALVGEFVYPTVTKALAWGLEGALKKKRSLN
ncbi:MAG: tRNA (N6-isopentenyl adenosine(37)-C2)-methylthiotransferase MiaB [Candidatus Kerfeldbacteria bacterium CG_4_10_14_0_8_um_filter_42_10]|uniref:tRNA-2-methylthio-N(6)-dimethylallyladenosine synthase n=1 Tax=Candidatus Kerfeldbacteria bacterium CG_4_10_14_0_8_um_filter_42_10 TaxID=2014248 RepID=A0A2M7RFP0_9BACT|nr:MAG: tRNA (N6-isopentenyl adenosine(37)-C2)-methylthiotransferase MiaB [Candidatus Kerfeldbacteria bacterium CG_4_10_14_0_8_um_filter_42_10]